MTLAPLVDGSPVQVYWPPVADPEHQGLPIAPPAAPPVPLPRAEPAGNRVPLPIADNRPWWPWDVDPPGTANPASPAPGSLSITPKNPSPAMLMAGPAPGGR